MNNNVEMIIEITNREYKGHSFNGPSLVKTLNALTMEQILSRETYEKFSAWKITLHLMYFKYKLLHFINPESPITFDYAHESFPNPPEDKSPESWKKTLSDMDKIHEAYIQELENIPENEFSERIEEWDCTIKEAIIWMTTHDTYHTAQIRNMGLKNLKISR